MDIDLRLLHNHSTSDVDISGSYILDPDVYQGMGILRLSPVKVEGKVTLKEVEDDLEVDNIFCDIHGVMTLPDSISLEEVEYPFEIHYDDEIPENCIKNENILDILGFLWENIVLEVPLQFTKVSDLSKFHGDGWRLIREEDRVLENNPFRELLDNNEEE